MWGSKLNGCNFSKIKDVHHFSLLHAHSEIVLFETYNVDNYGHIWGKKYPKGGEPK